MAMFFVDFETAEWDVPHCAVILSATGARTVYTGPDCAARVRHFQDRHPGTYIAHNGGGFDHLLTWRHGSPETAVLTGSRVLKATGNDGTTVWRDSLPRFLKPLKDIGTAVGLPKLDVNVSDVRNIPTAQLIEYCTRDVEILRKATLLLDAWLRDFGVIANTAGSGAIGVMQTTDPSTWAKLRAAWVPTDVLLGLRDGSLAANPYSAINGGRVELRAQGIIRGPIHSYDIKSSYPSRFFEGPLPVGCIPTDSTDLQEGPAWIDECAFHMPATALIPWELGRGGWGAGNLTQWLTREQACWLEGKGIKVRRHGRGFRAAFMVDNFAHVFYRHLFDLKDRGNPWAKVHINNPHGKYGEGPLKELHFRKPGAEWWDFSTEDSTLDRSPGDRTSYLQPITGAYVLARARMGWTEGANAVLSAGGQVYYGDTDSIHTDLPPSRVPLNIGNNMGQWSHEGEFTEGVYLANKLYALMDCHGKMKNAARGFNKEHVTWELYKQAATGGLKIEVPMAGVFGFRSGKLMGTARWRSKTEKVKASREFRPFLSKTRRFNDRGELEYLADPKQPT